MTLRLTPRIEAALWVAYAILVLFATWLLGR